MSPDPTALVASLGVEPTYSPREAAGLLGRSHSWLDQGLRAGRFALPDGTPARPLRTAGGYRRFTLGMLRDVAASSAERGWFTLDELRSAIRGLLIAAHAATGEYRFPG